MDKKEFNRFTILCFITTIVSNSFIILFVPEKVQIGSIFTTNFLTMFIWALYLNKPIK